MKIIIAGDGKVGETLARELSAEDNDITLIDSNRETLELSLQLYDVMVVEGNCALIETLERAGVRGADLLIAATSQDEINLVCCMTAYAINKNLHTIARIRNPEYSSQAHLMRDVFALSLAVNPEKQAATEISRLLKYPGFVQRETFAKGRVEIVELKLEKDSKLCDVSLKNLNSIIKCNVLICAVLRDGQAITPDGKFVLKQGDRIFVTAAPEVLSELLKNLGIITHKVKNVMIVGGGRIAYYLADSLLNSAINVQIIERDYKRCIELATLLPGASIINADASDYKLLDSEGLSICDALVSLTDMDELNMVISIFAQSCQVVQVITKLSRVENMKMLDTLPLGSVISPKNLCANTIIQYVRAMKNKTGAAVTVHSIADGQAEAVEFRIDDTSLNCGQMLKNIKTKENVLIVSIIRDGVIEIPNGNSSFSKGDTVVAVTNKDTVLYQFNDIFQ